MSLLELDRVSKSFGVGSRRLAVLRDVSLAVDPGELIAVWGARRSGRSTLLRVAAGITHADSGAVRFEGLDLGGRGGERLRAAIGFCLIVRHSEPMGVLERLITDQLVRGVSLRESRRRANAALVRVESERSAELSLGELGAAEMTRVAIAGALSHMPKLIVIDEPALGVDAFVRDQILTLLRSVADEGVAVLMSTDEGPCLSGADRALSLDQGQLQGDLSPHARDLAEVLPLRRSA